MHELLRLVHELTEARRYAPMGGEWEPFAGPLEFADKALTVITAYQELLSTALEFLQLARFEEGAIEVERECDRFYDLAKGCLPEEES